MRIRLDIEYDGTAYCGWQRQNNAISIQQKVEEAVKRVTGRQSTVHGSGRTDAGVHALRQTAHFDTDSSLTPERFAYALNYWLPEDIRVTNSEEVDRDFHARFSAKRKTYRYVIRNHPQRSALNRDFSAHESRPLDIDAMREGAAYLIGTHDFASFCANSSEENTVRTIERIDVWRDREYVTIEVAGTGFLHHMVRIIVGTLMDVGKGEMGPQALESILEERDRSKAGPTAPARGLLLVGADYDRDAHAEDGASGAAADSRPTAMEAPEECHCETR